MAKLHPFPAVRVQPVGFSRFAVISTTTIVTVGEVFARSEEDAIKSTKQGKLSNAFTADEHTTRIAFLHPSEAGEETADDGEAHREYGRDGNEWDRPGDPESDRKAGTGQA